MHKKNNSTRAKTKNLVELYFVYLKSVWSRIGAGSCFSCLALGVTSRVRSPVGPAAHDDTVRMTCDG